MTELCQSIIVNGIPITMDAVAQFAPIVCAYPTERFTPCTIEYLLHGASWSEVPLDHTGSPIWSGPGTPLDGTPTPDGIGALADGGSAVKIEIHASQFSGQGWQAPMYICPQVPRDASYVDLNYIFLSAYNGPQSVALNLDGKTINCQVPTFAEHQGDIESITVRVDSKFSTVHRVRYEAHGGSSYFLPDEVRFDLTGKRPYVGCALNSHASYNIFGQSDRYTIDLAVAGYDSLGATIADFVDPNGQHWQPSEFVFVGIDNGVPVNGQNWVRFAGCLGGYQISNLGMIQGADGNLSPEDQALAQEIAEMGTAMNNPPSDALYGIGTGGLANRPFIDVNAPVPFTSTITRSQMKRKKSTRLGNDKNLSRYHMYSLHYACFACRKMFNRPAWFHRLDRKGASQNVFACPDCGVTMHNMGKEFKPPRRNNLRQWRKVEMLFKRGYRWETKFDWIWIQRGIGKVGYTVPVSYSPRARTLRDAKTDYPPVASGDTPHDEKDKN